MRHFTLLFLSLLILSITPNAQPQSGRVPFDYPNEPFVEFRFDLDRSMIAMVMENADSSTAVPFNTLEQLHLRAYKARHFDKMLAHYGTNLKIRGWSALETNENYHLFTLTESETVIGVLIIVKSAKTVYRHSGDPGGRALYLINIDGRFAPEQISELVGNLNQVGVDIPELSIFGAQSNAASTSTLLRMPEGNPIHEVQLQANPTTIEPQIRTALGDGPDEIIAAMATLRGKLPAIQTLTVRIDTEVSKRIATIIVTVGPETGSLPTTSITDANETPQAQTSPTRFRTSEGKPIHEVRIRGNQGISESEIQTALESGPENIVEAITYLPLPDFNRVVVEIEGDDTRRIATIVIIEQPDTKGLRRPSVTGLWTAAGDPIHEVRIQGNQQISEAEIRDVLENGPDEIEKAVDHLPQTLPYFSATTLRFERDGTKRIAIITVAESRLSSDYYIYLAPLVHFNRVTGWLLGAHLEVGKRRKIGRLWTWDIPSSVRAHLPKFFGEFGYGFGNKNLNYRVGGDMIWGQPDLSSIGVSAQIHRATTAVAPELFPHSDGVYDAFGALGFHNYYLSKGVATSVRWAPVVPTHSFKLTMRAEAHESLQKTTDWQFGNWGSESEAEENPPIIPGQLRSATFRYDLNTRQDRNVGWYNTLLVEHSNPAVGSDFDFTRFQLQLRYAASRGDDIIRTRLMLGTATSVLPIQRQFIIGGRGTLSGYPLYAFAGDHVSLLNLEYFYHLPMPNPYGWQLLKDLETYIVLFLDQGQVWNMSDKPYRFDPKTSVGIGLQLWQESPFRFNLSKPLESERGIKFDLMWYSSF
jgi:hypothetical protein